MPPLPPQLRKRLSALVLSLLAAGCQSAAGVRAPAAAPVCDVYFSPRGGCTEQIVHAIGGATRQILVQAYSFTSPPIAQALIEARGRGVDVRVIVDKSQRSEDHTVADDLQAAGVPVLVDAAHAIAHNKIIVIDGQRVITGSFNFTKSAEERNAENVLVLRDAAISGRYARNWEEHAGHSSAFAGSPP